MAYRPNNFTIYLKQVEKNQPTLCPKGCAKSSQSYWTEVFVKECIVFLLVRNPGNAMQHSYLKTMYK